MKASHFREMSGEDLEAEAVSLSEQLFKLRFQLATGQLENVMKFRGVRKDLARVKTVLTEKRRASTES
jgi:large subunit ribosomal protein L29